MLQELQVTQPRGEPSRRWFRDERFDLIVWFEGDQILGFQLCYDRAGRERAVTWLPTSGYSHDRIDSGGDRPGLHPARILLPEPLNSFPHAELTLLEGAAAGLEPALREFVLSKLRAYRQSEPISLGGSLHVAPTEGILTPEDIDASRRHAAAMTDEQLAKLYVDGPEKWPAKAWEILTQELARRKRAREVGALLSSQSESRPRGSPTSSQERSEGRRMAWRVFSILWFIIAGVHFVTGSPVRALLSLVVGVATFSLSVREQP